MKNATHKQFIKWYKQYLNSDEKYLWQAYGRYSTEKENAYRRIEDRYCNNYTHYHLWILSHNSSHFVTGAICETPTQDYFVVETWCNTFICGYYHGELIDLKTGEVFYNE